MFPSDKEEPELIHKYKAEPKNKFKSELRRFGKWLGKTILWLVGRGEDMTNAKVFKEQSEGMKNMAEAYKNMADAKKTMVETAKMADELSESRKTELNLESASMEEIEAFKKQLELKMDQLKYTKGTNFIFEKKKDDLPSLIGQQTSLPSTEETDEEFQARAEKDLEEWEKLGEKAGAQDYIRKTQKGPTYDRHPEDPEYTDDHKGDPPGEES